jgi:hypothetical protein
MRPGGVAAALDVPSFASAANHPRRLSLSWFRLLRIFPFFLVSSWTTAPTFSIGLLKTNGIANIINNIGQPSQPYHVLPGDNTMGYPLVNTGEQVISADKKKKSVDDRNKKNDSSTRRSNNNNTSSTSFGSAGPPRPLSETDQKFLERVQSSIKTVQNWEADTQLLQECRMVIPWDDLRNATGPYSNVKDDRLLQGNALFLQRLSRWFPTFMSWVNTPPCQVCGSKECEVKTERPRE